MTKLNIVIVGKSLRYKQNKTLQTPDRQNYDRIIGLKPIKCEVYEGL